MLKIKVNKTGINQYYSCKYNEKLKRYNIDRKGIQTWLLLIIIIIGSAIIFLLSTSLYLLIAGGK